MIEARALLRATCIAIGLSNALTPAAHALCLSTDTSKDASIITTKVTTDAASRTRPNIILILADDLGWGDLSVQDTLKTPAIDRLAAEGTRFTQVQTPHRSHCDAHDTALTGSIDQETWAQRMV